MSNEKTPEKNGILTGFREFLMRGNVVELAVAVVVGTAFSKIVDAVVKGFINPLVGAVGTQDLDKYNSCLKGPCSIDSSGEAKGVVLNWGPVLSATLTFMITAAVVYFLMILPMNKYKERQAAKAGPVEVPKTEIELLTEIRDVLVAQRTGEPGSDGSTPASAPASASPESGSDASVARQRDGGVSTDK
ncbi:MULTISPECIES: large conductance mechanosensitive channel protein MscL [unclassified Streptomyces]|uniref:large conductance mechanosensitive channel protein MscL n=1 Tax=unclassified Streptomyces TaxID=2593676 RepID=UPI002DD9A771|nr:MULTISPECIES: large conductance mechanosensitive channel protein MscL [unclassified Streptomyces]WSA94172.1 large conductance mechanosensitive channel protein MscL [Streptomyces sp. NBC_01795]WSB78591.1 large conductance mechanosensitive channel protein MscL [Streptomyces sp. NBC_01775]WSS13216.1 large conductance mechanosensitive channel protein MscL [Streptomyces sp. NBC_01186]WSS42003.1 large conductance mechanosensitive channel protein MscL [Streptomyces sp. NBC_01187]